MDRDRTIGISIDIMIARVWLALTSEWRNTTCWGWLPLPHLTYGWHWHWPHWFHPDHCIRVTVAVSNEFNNFIDFLHSTKIGAFNIFSMENLIHLDWEKCLLRTTKLVAIQPIKCCVVLIKFWLERHKFCWTIKICLDNKKIFAE